MADRTELLLRDALTACADQVTEESLSLPPDLPRPKDRRWVALAAAAAVFVLAAGLAVLLLNIERSNEPITPPPPPPAPTSEPPACPSGKRCVIQTVDVMGETLELVAKKAPRMTDVYTRWVLRVAGGDAIGRGGTADGVNTGDAVGLPFVRADSLACFVFDGEPAVCLLDTSGLGDSNTTFGLSRISSGWYLDESGYPTPFGKESIDVHLDKAGGFIVVAVQHDPFLTGQPSWWARVWRWGGEELGCTKPVRTKEELPGWPEVLPDPATLDKANCGGY